MTLAPERISVKRRRDEDPLEALYIQSKKYRPSIVWTLQAPSDTLRSNPSSTKSLPNKDATVSTDLSLAEKTTLPRVSAATDAVSPRSDYAVRLQELEIKATEGHEPPIHSVSRPSATKSSTAQGKSGILQTAEPRVRRFQLSQETFPSLKRQPSFVGGIRKHRRPPRDTLALFVETKRGEKTIEQSIHSHLLSHTDLVVPQGDHAEVSPGGENASIRKRPNAGSAERAWRSETWGKQTRTATSDQSKTVDQKPTNWDNQAIELAEELRHFAIQQSEALGERHEHSTSPQLNPRPKPPELLESMCEPNARSMDVKPIQYQHNADDNDYIVDTYIRSTLQLPDTDLVLETSLDPLQAFDFTKIGVLVVEEGQEALWESFALEQLSETEDQSDEEDENAEDFHGNDYPEDEWDAEDVAERGSYDSCGDSSKNDEYNSDEAQWSAD